MSCYEYVKWIGSVARTGRVPKLMPWLGYPVLGTYYYHVWYDTRCTDYNYNVNSFSVSGRCSAGLLSHGHRFFATAQLRWSFVLRVLLSYHIAVLLSSYHTISCWALQQQHLCFIDSSCQRIFFSVFGESFRAAKMTNRNRTDCTSLRNTEALVCCLLSGWFTRWGFCHV